MKKDLLKLALCAFVAVLPIGAWADDAVSTQATWLFNQFYDGVILGTENNAAEIKYNFNKLYIALGTGNRTLTAKAENMPNETAPVVGTETPFAKGMYVGLTFNARSSTFGNYAADKSNANQQMVAMKFSTAGKVYALVKPSYKDGETRTVQVYEGATQTVKETCTSTSDGKWFVISCDVTNDRRYFIGSVEASWTLYAVKFIPGSDANDRTDNNITVSVKNGYATFSSACNYRVPAGYKAYVVSSVNATTATLSQIARIPANTGVILIGDDKKSETITMQNLRESEITDEIKTIAASNKLVANVGEYGLPANNGSNYNYILTTDGFKHSSGSGDLSANKAFLRTTTNVTASARGLELNFGEGDVTGISEIEKLRNVGNEKFFDLQGRLVAQPTKGLYIVNGKKVIIK